MKKRPITLTLQLETDAPTDDLVDIAEWKNLLWFNFRQGKYNFAILDVSTREAAPKTTP